MAPVAHVLALSLLLVVSSACGIRAQSVASPSPSPVVEGTSTPSATPAAPTPSPTAPVATPTPGGAPSTIATPTPPPSTAPSPTPPPPPVTGPPAGRVEVLAPIEGVAVLSTGAGAATARITSGLPSGCAVYSRAIVTRTAAGVRVEVYNHQPTGNVACTAIYGFVTKDVPLGSGFDFGVPYTIEVNDTRQQFTLR